MAVKIRLRRMGNRHRAFYRLIVADSRAPRDGRFLQELGIYNPMTDPAEIRIDAAGVKKWVERGAQMSDTAKSLLKRAGVLVQGKLVETPEPTAAVVAPVAAPVEAAPVFEAPVEAPAEAAAPEASTPSEPAEAAGDEEARTEGAPA